MGSNDECGKLFPPVIGTQPCDGSAKGGRPRVDDHGYRDDLRPDVSHPSDERLALDRQQPD